MDESITSFARPRSGNEGASAVLSAVSSVRMFSPIFAVLLLILPDYFGITLGKHFLDIFNDFLVFTENQRILTPPGPAQNVFKIFCKNFCSAKIFEP